MKLLLQAALRSRKHLSLFCITLISLFALTTASQIEMFSLGLISNAGADFFTLFAPDEADPQNPVEEISWHDVEKKWGEIDHEGSGMITREQARAFLAEKKDGNPLQWVFNQIKGKLDITQNIPTLILLLIGVALYKALSLFVSRYTTQLLSIRISRDLRQQYFEHLQSLPLSFYQEHNIGALSSRVMGDAQQIASSLNSCLTNYLQTPFTIFTTLSICFYMSWQLSSVIFIGLPLIILPIVLVAKKVKKASRQLQINQERFASVLIDFLAGIQTIKIFAMELFSLKKYKEQNEKMAQLESKTAKYGLLTRPILHMITSFCLVGVILFGLYGAKMSLSKLLVFCGLLQLVYEPVKKFAEENANVQRGLVAAERLFEVLHLKPHIEDREDAVDLVDFKDSIVFDHVWFSYLNAEGKKEWVLKDLTFTIRKGETVAFVGPTGAGKSTIVQLMPRLYEVQKGEIRIDGKPLQAYTQKSLREKMGFVPQKPFLFLDTVAANIAYGRNFSQEEIAHAAKRAHAEEFIQRLPQQYQTLLAEGGKNLSGGQQQRLAIARALVKNAPIIILDEATSALDVLSEKKIKDAIAALHGDITQILIAHRLGTIEHADKIIYLDQGRKIAEGTKEELLATCPEFRAMWETLSLKEDNPLPS